MSKYRSEGSHWDIGLFEPGDCTLCMYSYCCVCCAVGTAKSHTDDSECLLNCCCFGVVATRWLIRTAQSIDGDSYSDFFAGTFCPCCTVNQMLQTSVRRGNPFSHSGRETNIKPWKTSMLSHLCSGSTCLDTIGTLLFSLFCMPCSVAAVLEESIGMPFCMGCCCVNPFAARNLIRYQYHIDGLDVREECCYPCCLVTGAASVALLVGYPIASIPVVVAYFTWIVGSTSIESKSRVAPEKRFSFTNNFRSSKFSATGYMNSDGDDSGSINDAHEETVNLLSPTANHESDSNMWQGQQSCTSAYISCQPEFIAKSSSVTTSSVSETAEVASGSNSPESCSPHVKHSKHGRKHSTSSSTRDVADRATLCHSSSDDESPLRNSPFRAPTHNRDDSVESVISDYEAESDIEQDSNTSNLLNSLNTMNHFRASQQGEAPYLVDNNKSKMRRWAESSGLASFWQPPIPSQMPITASHLQASPTHQKSEQRQQRQFFGETNGVENNYSILSSPERSDSSFLQSGLDALAATLFTTSFSSEQSRQQVLPSYSSHQNEDSAKDFASSNAKPNSNQSTPSKPYGGTYTESRRQAIKKAKEASEMRKAASMAANNRNSRNYW